MCAVWRIAEIIKLSVLYLFDGLRGELAYYCFLKTFFIFLIGILFIVCVVTCRFSIKKARESSTVRYKNFFISEYNDKLPTSYFTC